MDREARIKACLEAALSPTKLVLKDCSHAHRHHASAKASGGGHYQLQIAASGLSKQALLASHKKIYAALGELMHTEIHALSIDILSQE